MSLFIIILFLHVWFSAALALNNAELLSHPNILFILTDDWGNNDVGFTQDNTDIQTPYLDNLAKHESLIISNYYAQVLCSATRGSFLTGRYPANLGLQSTLQLDTPYSLTRQVSMLSNELQDSSIYSTHLIGKWHLGFSSFEYTPTYRGFDSFHGFWSSEINYYSHVKNVSIQNQMISAIDLHRNEYPSNEYDGIYGMEMQRDETLKLLETKVNDKNDSKPFFIYLALQGSHDPRQAPNEYCEVYEGGVIDDNYDRITFMAQTTYADDVIKEIIEYIKKSFLWENSLIVFSSDNGGTIFVGDNSPYRGFKKTSWEGGIKVPCFVTGGALNKERMGEIMNYFMNVVDWYPTLMSAAGLNIRYRRSKRLYKSDKVDTKWDDTIEIPLDGIDMWEYIQNNEKNDKYFDDEREMLLDLKKNGCNFSSCGALRTGRFKYVRGNTVTRISEYHVDGDLWFREYASDQHIADRLCTENMEEFISVYNIDHPAIDKNGMINSIGCQDRKQGCLFDLKLDPCEYYDLSNKKPKLVEEFEYKLDQYQIRSQVELTYMKLNNNDWLDYKEISPNYVCKHTSSDFWCPYLEYDKVYFEYELYGSSLDVRTEDNHNNKKSSIFTSSILYGFLGILIVIQVFFISYSKLSNYQQIDINPNGKMNEFAPLI